MLSQGKEKIRDERGPRRRRDVIPGEWTREGGRGTRRPMVRREDRYYLMSYIFFCTSMLMFVYVFVIVCINLFQSHLFRSSGTRLTLRPCPDLPTRTTTFSDSTVAGRNNCYDRSMEV